MNFLFCFDNTPPGITQFTLVEGAKWTARYLVRLTTPAFETPYPTSLCDPSYSSGFGETIP